CHVEHLPPTSGSTCCASGWITMWATVGSTLAADRRRGTLVESRSAVAGGAVGNSAVGRTYCHGVQVSRDSRAPCTVATHEYPAAVSPSPGGDRRRVSVRWSLGLTWVCDLRPSPRPTSTRMESTRPPPDMVLICQV